MQRLLHRLSALLLAVLLAPGAAPLAEAAEVRVDPAKRYQTMTGWEVTARVTETDKKNNRFNPAWHAHSDAIFDTLVNEIGVNRLRLEIRSGMENTADFWSQFVSGALPYEEYRKTYYLKINDNSDPNKINPAGFHFSELDYQVNQILKPMMARAGAMGEKIYINLCFVDFDKGKEQTRFTHAGNAPEYAELVLAAFQHLKAKYGIVPDALEVILEPDNTARWNRGGRMIGEAGSAAMKRLTKAGFSPELILPATKRADLAVKLFEEALQAPGLGEHAGVLAYHRYSQATPDVLRQIAAGAARHGVRVEMLEHVHGDVRHLHEDLTVANASAWQSYSIGAWQPPERKYPLGAMVYFDRETGKAVPSQQGKHLMQYMRYVRHGAQRIGATVDAPKFGVVAFENKDGGQVVVVRAAEKGPVVIHGLKEDEYAATYAYWKSGGNPTEVSRNPADGSVTVQMPAEGEVTVFPARMAR